MTVQEKLYKFISVNLCLVHNAVFVWSQDGYICIQLLAHKLVLPSGIWKLCL